MTTRSFSTKALYAITIILMLVSIEQTHRIYTLKSLLQADHAELLRLKASNAMTGLRVTSLEARDAAYQASKIIIAYDPNLSRGTIAMQNLPAPAAGYNYQLWVLDPGALTPLSAGLISQEKPSATFEVKPLSTANPGFAITLEPGAGSPEPTGSILFAVAPGQ